VAELDTVTVTPNGRNRGLTEREEHRGTRDLRQGVFTATEGEEFSVPEERA